MLFVFFHNNDPFVTLLCDALCDDDIYMMYKMQRNDDESYLLKWLCNGYSIVVIAISYFSSSARE